MQIFTDQLLTRASIDKLARLRSEIIASYSETKNTLWTKSKTGGKYKLSSSKLEKKRNYLLTEEIIKTLISGKIMRRYFYSLRDSSLVHNAEALPYKEYSIKLGMKLLEKYAPEFIDDNKIWRLNISPLQIRSKKQFGVLKDAAEELESQTGITPAIPSLHFSILKHGTYIPIHVDDQSKILSVMLYLASPEQNNNVNLGTSFWYPHNPNNQILDSTGTAAYEDEKIQNAIRSNFLEHRSPFVVGSIVSFLKTSSSWHSFSYDGPNLGPRVSLNLNIHSFR